MYSNTLSHHSVALHIKFPTLYILVNVRLASFSSSLDSSLPFLRSEFPVSVQQKHVINWFNQLTGKLSTNALRCRCTIGFVVL